MHRILIIEDDPGIRLTLVEVLRLEGFDVDSVCNGQEALDLLINSNSLPEVIILDLMMPVLDGWEFLRVRSQNPDVKLIPVIVTSATHSTHQVGDVDAFISKPIDLEDLLSVVRHLCFKRSP